jgi:hypothetical protein
LLAWDLQLVVTAVANFDAKTLEGVLMVSSLQSVTLAEASITQFQ